MIILDGSLTVLHENTQVTEWLGSSAMGEFISRKHEELHAACCAALSGRSRRLSLNAFPWTTGDRSLDVECLPTRLGGAPGVVLLLRDDSELGGLRATVSRISRSETIARLVGGIAHDINNLLTGIRGSLALAAQRPSEGSRKDALAAADSAAERAGEVARQLLSFGGAGGQRQDAVTTDPAPVLRETTALLSCMLDGIAVELDIAEDLGLVRIPAAQLHRIVLNLLLNARDSVREAGEGRVSLSAGPTLLRRPGDGRLRKWLELSVRDTGLGMAPATQVRIFEPFFSTKSEGNANGLGLTSVRSLLEQAGGWVEVESELAQGTCFNVYLPFVGEGVAMRVENSTVGAAAAGGRVLICDDETRLATLTAGLLEEYGYESATVSEGDEVLEIVGLKNAPVDVLLLDVNLGAGISAGTLLERMHSLGSQIPVILTSGFAPEDLPVSLREHSRVKSYLAKPYTVEELVDAIADAMQSAV